jgi:hypothetical protein
VAQKGSQGRSEVGLGAGLRAGWGIGGTRISPKVVRYLRHAAQVKHVFRGCVVQNGTGSRTIIGAVIVCSHFYERLEVQEFAQKPEA